MIKFSGVPIAKKLVAALAVIAMATGLMVAGSGAAGATPGQRDTGFTPEVNNAVNSLAPAGSGYLIGGSFSEVGGQERLGIAKVTDTGSLDASFTSPLGVNAQVQTIVPDGSGFLIGGQFDVLGAGNSQRKNLIRINSNGSVDSNFEAVLLDNFVYSILKVGGGFLVGGSFNSVGGYPNQHRVIKVNPDGTLDESFQAPMTLNGSVFAMTPAQGSGYIIGGTFTAPGPDRLMKLTSNGAVDGGFSPPALNSSVFSLASAGDGYLVGGQFTNVSGESYLIRLIPDGGLKGGFSSPVNGAVEAIVPDGDGFFIGGGFYNIEGAGNNQFARIAGNTGAVDTSFPPPMQGMNSKVTAILNHDGAVVVGGWWTSPSPARLVRIFNSSLPMAESQNASNVKAYTATGRGTVTANNAPTLVRCAVSKSSSIVNPRYVNASPSSVPANTVNRAVSCSFTKLEPQTKYYYEVQATNVVGGVASSTRVFTTGAQKPGVVRSLKVAGRVAASKRKVTWAQPSLPGAKSVTYQAQVKRGSKVRKKYSGAKRSWSFTKRGLRPGKYTVQARAKNLKGYGPWVKKSIRVR